MIGGRCRARRPGDVEQLHHRGLDPAFGFGHRFSRADALGARHRRRQAAARASNIPAAGAHRRFAPFRKGLQGLQGALSATSYAERRDRQVRRMRRASQVRHPGSPPRDGRRRGRATERRPAGAPNCRPPAAVR
jgi:hypothetical protein